MENVLLPPYDLLECSHALLEHILIFHHKENLGLFSVQAHIQMLVYGCLEGYLKLSILLLPNHAFVYNIVGALHHHMVKKTPPQISC
jgi:hypothetical protein